MFSRYKKPGAGKPAGGGNQKLHAVPNASAPPAAKPAGAAPAAPAPKATLKAAPVKAAQREAARAAAKPEPMDREKKRRQRLGEIKQELHKQLLDNLNLAALDTASEKDLRAEISSISAEVLTEMNVVLNREEKTILNQELFDEVTGLGPLEPLLKDDSDNIARKRGHFERAAKGHDSAADKARKQFLDLASHFKLIEKKLK